MVGQDLEEGDESVVHDAPQRNLPTRVSLIGAPLACWLIETPVSSVLSGRLPSEDARSRYVGRAAVKNNDGGRESRW